jgi:carbamoyltransferase|tara:strand:+ start:1114 stop:1272 length:159 start_codon:yes stop_codon:yes gene_type:complete
MINGRIIASVSEERFSRVKNDERYPINAINWILKNYKINTKNIEAVCIISKM